MSDDAYPWEWERQVWEVEWFTHSANDPDSHLRHHVLVDAHDAEFAINRAWTWAKAKKTNPESKSLMTARCRRLLL